ncbi:MAG: hypothetical protein KY410_05440, partial [Proteobacteria bacterium]|nr:hypothetical protein [Pseudomonadota bacterium]
LPSMAFLLLIFGETTMPLGKGSVYPEDTCPDQRRDGRNERSRLSKKTRNTIRERKYSAEASAFGSRNPDTLDILHEEQLIRDVTMKPIDRGRSFPFR